MGSRIPRLPAHPAGTDPASAILGRMIPVGSHPALHPLFESLAYASGYAIFRWQRSRRGDVVDEPQRWTLIAAAAVGAMLGSRLLGLTEQWPAALAAMRAGHFLAFIITPGGKTIVGGLLGGWLGVELAKRSIGVRTRTGDLFVAPLCVGIAVGRIGCFLAGLADDTYGKPATVPWAVDFGDHIARHPVQLYEIAYLSLLLVVTAAVPAGFREGSRFRIFMAAYLAWRLGIDFLKPQPLILGMNLIQWACVAGLCILGILEWLAMRSSARKLTAHASIA